MMIFLNHCKKEDKSNMVSMNLNLNSTSKETMNSENDLNLYFDKISKISSLHKEHFTKIRDCLFDPDYNGKLDSFEIDEKMLGGIETQESRSRGSHLSQYSYDGRELEYDKYDKDNYNNYNNYEKSFLNSSTSDDSPCTRTKNKKVNKNRSGILKMPLQKKLTVPNLSPKFSSK